MKAVIMQSYGPPDVLTVKELPKPTIGNNEYLIKVKAATVTAGDCEIRRSDIPLPIIFWLPLRIIFGLFKPKKNTILGQEMAGEVIEVGKDIDKVKPGDQIFGISGLRNGAYCEIKKHSKSFAIGNKPQNVSWRDVVTIPVGAINALHFIRLASIKPGQKVCIYGSTGSIGTYAVQLAKYYGAHVTAVCTTDRFELMKDIGADEVIDYQLEDFTRNKSTYDVLFEAVGKSSFEKGLKTLKKGGVYLLANPKFYQLFKGAWISKFGNYKVISAFAGESNEDLNFLANLMSEGKIKAVIDREFKLESMVEAHKYVELGHKTGHVVINI